MRSAIPLVLCVACDPPEPVPVPDHAEIAGSATFDASGWTATEEADLFVGETALCRWSFAIEPVEGTQPDCADYDGDPCEVSVVGELTGGTDLGGCDQYGWDDGRYSDGGPRAVGWVDPFFYGGIDEGPRLVWWDDATSRWTAVTAAASYDAANRVLAWTVPGDLAEVR